MISETKILILSSKPLYEFDQSLKNAEGIAFAHQRGFSGIDTEFLAIVTLSGVAIKAVSEVVLAMIRKNENIEIKVGDKSVKGLSCEKATEIFSKLENNERE